HSLPWPACLLHPSQEVLFRKTSGAILPRRLGLAARRVDVGHDEVGEALTHGRFHYTAVRLNHGFKIRTLRLHAPRQAKRLAGEFPLDTVLDPDSKGKHLLDLTGLVPKPVGERLRLDRTEACDL